MHTNTHARTHIHVHTLSGISLLMVNSEMWTRDRDALYIHVSVVQSSQQLRRL